jgi:hypothetical protein
LTEDTLYLASIPQERVDLFRSDPGHSLRARQLLELSRTSLYRLQAPGLRSALHELINDGLPLSPALWPPLRAPKVQPAPELAALFARIETHWNELREHPARRVLLGGMPEIELSRLVEFVSSAVQHQEAMLCFLDTVSHAQSARRLSLYDIVKP